MWLTYVFWKSRISAASFPKLFLLNLAFSDDFLRKSSLSVSAPKYSTAGSQCQLTIRYSFPLPSESVQAGKELESTETAKSSYKVQGKYSGSSLFIARQILNRPMRDLNAIFLYSPHLPADL